LRTDGVLGLDTFKVFMSAASLKSVRDTYCTLSGVLIVIVPDKISHTKKMLNTFCCHTHLTNFTVRIGYQLNSRLKQPGFDSYQLRTHFILHVFLWLASLQA
jgi:hypothetical protein